jgi:hypothetical protein
MTDHGGVLIVRDDGVTVLPDAIPVVRGMVEAVELLFASLGIPTRDQRQERTEEAM